MSEGMKVKPCPVCGGEPAEMDNDGMLGCLKCCVYASPVTWDALPRVRDEDREPGDSSTYQEQCVAYRGRIEQWRESVRKLEDEVCALKEERDEAVEKLGSVNQCGMNPDALNVYLADAMSSAPPVATTMSGVVLVDCGKDVGVMQAQASEDAIITALTAPHQVHVAELADAARQCGLYGYGHDTCVEFLNLLGVEVIE